MLDPKITAAALALCASCAAGPPERSVVQPPRAPGRANAVRADAQQSRVPEPAPAQARSRPEEEDDGPLFGRPAFRIYGGYFEASAPQGFANETQRYSLGVGATWVQRRNRIFALDADLFWTKREFDALIANPPGPPIPSRADLSTIGLSGGGRATFPTEGQVRLYGGGGLGVYWSELSARGTGSGSGFSRSDSNFSPGAYLLAGVDVTLGQLILGLNYRRWFVETDFSAFSLENVDLGGDFLGLVIGGTF